MPGPEQDPELQEAQGTEGDADPQAAIANADRKLQAPPEKIHTTGKENQQGQPLSEPAHSRAEQTGAHLPSID